MKTFKNFLFKKGHVPWNKGRIRTEDEINKSLINRQVYIKEYNIKNKDKIKEKCQKYHLRLKKEILNEYGGLECACCGEKHIEFLSLDHKNGGGNKERKSLTGSDRNGGYHFYQLLKNAGFPNKDKYQVLCMNCQFGTLNGRICPHKR